MREIWSHFIRNRQPLSITVEAAVEAGGGAVWIREDGALCIGNECMVIKRRADSRDLDIEIKLSPISSLTLSTRRLAGVELPTSKSSLN